MSSLGRPRRRPESAAPYAAAPVRLSVGGVADEWVTQLLRQGDSMVFKKYSQMKLQMKREALTKLNRKASEVVPIRSDTEKIA